MPTTVFTSPIMTYYITDPIQIVTWGDSIVQKFALPANVDCGPLTWTDDLPVDRNLFTKTAHSLSVQTSDPTYAETTHSFEITVSYKYYPAVSYTIPTFTVLIKDPCPRETLTIDAANSIFTSPALIYTVNEPQAAISWTDADVTESATSSCGPF